MTVIEYRGDASRRVITPEEFAPFGIVTSDDIVWDKTNGWEVDVPDYVAVFLLGLGSEFTTEDPTDWLSAFEALIPSGGGGVPSAHATTHGVGGSDSVTLAQSQVTGLVAALAGKLATTVLDTDPTLAADSDLLVATQKAAKAYMDGLIAAANALIYKGTIDCSVNPNYPAASTGWLYVASVAGKIGGASGTSVDVGDFIICRVTTGAGTQAAVGGNWSVIQTNLVNAYVAGGTNVAIADGGTGADTDVDALTNLLAPTQLGLSKAVGPTIHPALHQLRRAWANRTTAPVKVMWIADSQTTFSKVHRSFAIAAANAMNPPNRGLGTYNAEGTIVPGDIIEGVGGTGPVWTTTTGLSQSDKVANRGRTGDAISMSNNKDLTTPSITCTSVTFRWQTPVSGTGQVFDFYVDGVLTAPNTGIVATARGSYTISGLTAGAHTFKIVARCTTGACLFDLVDIAYGNETAGFRQYTAGHNGMTIADFNGYANLAPDLAEILPDLVLIEPFTNYASTAGATMFADLGTLIDTVQANCRASIALVMPNATLGDINWEYFRRLVRQQADIKDCFFVDLTAAMPDLGLGTVYWTRSGANITLNNLPNHGINPGDSFSISASSATTPLPNAGYTAASVTPSTITFVGVNSGATSGTATLTRTVHTIDGVHYTGFARTAFGQSVYSAIFSNAPAAPKLDLTPTDVIFGLHRNRRSYSSDLEEFNTAITANGRIPGTPMYVTVSGAAAQVTQAETALFRPGVAQLESGTSATGFASLNTSLYGVTMAATQEWKFFIRRQTPALSTGLQTYKAMWGFADLWNGSVLNGMYIRQAHGVTNFECVVVLAGTETAVDSGVAAGVGFAPHAIIYDPKSGIVTFYIGVVRVDVVSPNLPIGAAMTPGAAIIASVGTTTKLLQVDMIGHSVPDLRTIPVITP